MSCQSAPGETGRDQKCKTLRLSPEQKMRVNIPLRILAHVTCFRNVCVSLEQEGNLPN
ncbi:unnamed protein product [Staurois parvus]|uniref:Uncharacterized protein n=1 Tax=Staurois parvus TaxID=386267 RepID=A0ABN9G4W7_9NEOB|nr:unnamed protein product [Staurois parvus]